MDTWVIIASGQSLTDEQINLVKAAKDAGKIKGVIAVSNVGIDKAPWADALVSHDSAWWTSYPEAVKFAGKKYSRNAVPGTIGYNKPFMRGGINSGLMAMYIAKYCFEADRLILLGFDMHGTHYFGPHVGERLRNTPPDVFAKHMKQFDKFSDRFRGHAVINSTIGSALTIFPYVELREALCI